MTTRDKKSTSLSLVVLAAGIGSRYGGLKQMDPMGPSGEFIIDYSIYDALRAGFDRVVFVISRQIEDDFRQGIGARIERRCPVDYVRQELTDLPAGFSLPPDRKKPWGTGHAILACRNVVQTPFAAINADDFYGKESYRVLADFLRQVGSKRDTYAMVGFLLRNTLSEHGHVARGICDVDEKGLLKSVVERTRVERTPQGARFAVGENEWGSLTGSELASMNMWGFSPSILDHLAGEFPRFLSRVGQDPKAEFFIPTVVDGLIREGKAETHVLETPETWFGVTYPQDKPVVVNMIRRLIASGVYPSKLWT